MKLTPELVPTFLRLIRPEDIEARTRKFLARVSLDDYFIDDTGAASVEADGPASFHLILVGDPTPGVVAEAIRRAEEQGGRQVDLRTVASSLSESLPTLGFTFRHRRVEFKTPLSELPTAEGSPLDWRPAGENEAAAILHRASEGDPDACPGGFGLDVLRSWLSDPVLTHAPECVQVSDAGIVIAQVHPETRWSRITYMGLLPDHRGQDLGKWVHRRGFDMMRSQGGETYQGGTVETNRPMIRLFEKHGCRPLKVLEEWRATAGPEGFGLSAPTPTPRS